MTAPEKLRLLLIRDFVYFAVMVGYFFLPDPFGLLLFAATIFLVGRRVEKALRESDTKLESPQKRLYFVATCFYFLVLIGLLLSWILRHSGPPAWAMGGLGLLVLFTLLYASYDSVYGRNAKV